MTRYSNDMRSQRIGSSEAMGMGGSRDAMIPGGWICEKCARTCVSPSCPVCGAAEDESSYCRNDDSFSLQEEDAPVPLSLKSRLKGSFLGRGKKNKSKKNLSDAQSFLDDCQLEPSPMSDASSKNLVRVIEERYRRSDRTNVVLVDEESRRGEEEARRLAAETGTALQIVDSMTDHRREIPTWEASVSKNDLRSEVSDSDSSDEEYVPRLNTGGYISSDDETEPPLVVNRGGEDDGDRPVARKKRNVSPMPPRRKLTKGSSPVPCMRKRFESPLSSNRRPPVPSPRTESPMSSQRNRLGPHGATPREVIRSSVPPPPVMSPTPSPSSRKKFDSTLPRDTVRPPMSSNGRPSPMSSPRKRFESAGAPPRETARSFVPAPLMESPIMSPRKKVESSILSPSKKVGSSRDPVQFLRELSRSPEQRPPGKLSPERLSREQNPPGWSPLDSGHESFEWSVAPSRENVGSPLPTRPRGNSRSPGRSRKRFEPSVAPQTKNVRPTVPPPRKTMGSQSSTSKKKLESPLVSDRKKLELSGAPSRWEPEVTLAPSQQSIVSPRQQSRKAFLESQVEQQTILESARQSPPKISESNVPRKSKLDVPLSTSQKVKNALLESPRLNSMYRRPKILESSVTGTSRTVLESSAGTAKPHKRSLGSRIEELPALDDDPIRSLMPIRKSFNSSHNSSGSDWIQDFNASESSLQDSTWGNPVGAQNAGFNASDPSLQDSTWGNPIQVRDESRVRVHTRSESDSNQDSKTWDDRHQTTDQSRGQVQRLSPKWSSDKSFGSFEHSGKAPSTSVPHQSQAKKWSSEKSLGSFERLVKTPPPPVPVSQPHVFYHHEEAIPEDSIGSIFPSDIDPSNQQSLSPIDFMAPAQAKKKGCWTCSACTFENENDLHLMCAMCGTQRERGSTTNLEGSMSSPVPHLEESQKEVVKTRSQAIEEEWFDALQQERVDELVQLQRELFDEYAGKQNSQTVPTQQSFRNMTSRLDDLAQIHEQDRMRSMEMHSRASVTTPNQRVDRGYDARIASLVARGRQIQEMQRQQDLLQQRNWTGN